MTQRRNATAVLLIAALLFTLLSGCGQSAQAGTPSSSATPSTPAASVSTAAEPAASTEPVAPPDPMGKFDTEVVVQYMRDANAGIRFFEGESYTDNIWSREYLTELNIRVEEPISAEGEEAYTTKLNLLIASNALPDLFRLTNAGQLDRLIQGDMVEDLKTVFDDYASPFVKEVMQRDNGRALAQCTINGSLFAYPTQPLIDSEMPYTFVREDLVKAVGKASPTTMEELIDITRAFVAAGKTETGFAFGNKVFDSYMGMTGFFNAYGAFPGTWLEKDGKLVYGSIQPQMKDALASLAALYQEGLISKEFVTMDSYAASQTAVAGKAGVCFGQFWVNSWPLPDAYTADQTVDWRPYPILYAASAPEQKVQARATALSGGANTYAVRKGFAHPEVVAKMHNYFMEKSYGATADDKKYRKEGDIEIFSWAVVKGGLSYNNLEQSQMVTKAIDTKDTSVLLTSEAKNSHDMVKAFLDGTDVSSGNMQTAKFFYGPQSVFGIHQNWIDRGMILTDAFYGSDTPEMMRRMAILKSNEEEMILKVITGEQTVDAFDEFAANWLSLGGETITIEVNNWKAQNK